jgi:hypothetical protein
MKDPNVEYARTGSRAGKKPTRQSPAVDPPPPDKGFEGERQCSDRSRGPRCPNEALPTLRICAIHYQRRVETGANPVPTGRYAAALHNPELRGWYATAEADPKLKDSRAEIALAQSAVTAFLTVAGKDRASFAAAAPDVVKYADSVSKMQDRAIQQDILRGSFISRATFTQIFLGIADLLIVHIHDPHKRQSLADAILDLIRPFLAGDTAATVEPEAPEVEMRALSLGDGH